jgi:hypothetical protein
MDSHALTEQQAAARLLGALQEQDTLSCEEAQALLPSFVEAEAAGEDVDAASEYAALLRHLDICDDCAAMYEQLAEELEALTSAPEALPQTTLTPPSFFTTARQSENVIVRVLQGLRRQFELDLALPRLAPQLPTLGGGQSASLFTDTLSEVSGSPLVSISLTPSEGGADVLVAIREPAAQTRWQVQLIVGDHVQTATTNAQGMARFSGVPVTDVQQVRLMCVEAPGS